MIEVRPNVMDRMMSAFSPERGLKRMAARASLAAATAMTAPTEPGGRIFGRGGYKGAHSDRRQTRGWFARARSANADVLGDQKTMIARCRDAAMNMPLATAVIERNVTFTVGTGLMAIPELDHQRLGISEEQAVALSSQIAADYDNYMASTDPDAERTATGYGLQEVILRSALESGDVLQLRVMPENQIGRRSTTAFKLIEADRIVSPSGHSEGSRWVRPAPSPVARTAGVSQTGVKPGERIPAGAGLGEVTGNVVTGGVEVDDYGAPLAFHVLRKAPDSFGAAARSGRMAGDTVRIEAWGARSKLPTAMLVMAKRRPEQTRGISMLAPVLEALRQVSDLTEAELFAAVLQGMLAIIYKSPGAGAMPEPDYGEEGSAEAAIGLDNPASPLTNYRLEAGTILELDTAAGAEMKSPGRPNPAFDPFFMAITKQISAALDTPQEVVMLSFLASYSASRAALETFYIKVMSRRDWMASHSETPRYQAWLYEQVARGRYRMPGFLTNETLRARWSNVRFRGDGKISLNPVQEAKAYEVYEQHAWMTGAQITAEITGGDYDANVGRRIGEHQRFVKGDLPIPGAKGGGAAPAAEHRETEVQDA